MLLAKSLRMLFGVGLVLFAVGCAPVASTPMPVPSIPSLPPPTPTTPPVQNTPTPATTVKRIIGQSLSAYTSGLYGLAFTPDGNTLVSASHASDGLTITLWNVATGQPIDMNRDLNRDDGMALSPDGKMLAYGKCGELDPASHCSQYEIILWNVATRQPTGQPLIFHPSAPADFVLLFSPYGKTLAAMSSGTTGSGIIQLFDVTTRQPIALPLGGEVQFTSMAFSPDGRFMALGSVGGGIYIWGVERNVVFTTLHESDFGFVWSVAFSPDGKTLASQTSFPLTTGTRNKIVLWDLGTQQPIGQPLMSQITTGLAITTGITFSPDGKTLASIDENGAITLWDVTTHQLIGQAFMGQSATGGVAATTSIAFSPDGKTLASGADDGTITLWNLTTSSHSP